MVVMISVVVPAYNSEKTIADTIRALLKQNFPKKNYEIIIVDDGSTDGTVEVASKFPVRVLRLKHKGPANARNEGAKKARGEIILFTDADCIPDKNWIREITKPFADKNIVGVGGTYKTYNKDSAIARFAGYEIDERHEKMKKQREIDFLGTFSCAYRKNIFSKFGGFDTKFKTASGEDPELSFKISKAGYKMIFQPTAFVYHRHPNTPWKFLRKKFWNGYWRVLLYKKHREKIFRHSYTPKILYIQIPLAALSVLFLLLSLIGASSPSNFFAFFIIYLILALPFSFAIYKNKKDTDVATLSPFIMFLRDFATGLGIACGIITLIIKKNRIG
jgi:cellulose synthase/poly-beta-1,6-N-acetylglucosamine synthase-like glycosyltransferase